MDDLISGKSRIDGTGVFANRDFEKGERIIQIRGKLLTFEQVPTHFSKKVVDHYVQVGKKVYMGPSGGMDDLINHSCSPNTGYEIRGKKVWLVAIGKIKKGTELTWDYSTTMDEDSWEMDCNCGSKGCRHRIRDFKYLPKKVQKRYAKLGVVPKYNLVHLK